MPKRKAPPKREEASKKKVKVALKEVDQQLKEKAIEQLFILAREDRFLNNGMFHISCQY